MSGLSASLTRKLAVVLAGGALAATPALPAQAAGQAPVSATTTQQTINECNEIEWDVDLYYTVCERGTMKSTTVFNSKTQTATYSSVFVGTRSIYDDQGVLFFTQSYTPILSFSRQGVSSWPEYNSTYVVRDTSTTDGVTCVTTLTFVTENGDQKVGRWVSCAPETPPEEEW